MSLEAAIDGAISALEDAKKHPYGSVYDASLVSDAGRACVKLAGDPDKGRTLWKLIVEDLGYMPQAAVVALIRAANTENLVPDIPEPDLDGPR